MSALQKKGRLVGDRKRPNLGISETMAGQGRLETLHPYSCVSIVARPDCAVRPVSSFKSVQYLAALETCVSQDLVQEIEQKRI